MSMEYTIDKAAQTPSISSIVRDIAEKLESAASVPQTPTTGNQSNLATSSIPVAAVNQIRSSVVSPGSTPVEIFNATGSGNSSLGANVLSSLLLGPVWTTLLGLFGCRDNEQSRIFQRFEAPSAVSKSRSAQTSEDGRGQDIRRDSFGMSTNNVIATPPVNISIQALDARSILDRSDDIAAALKHALLFNHNVNDGLSEL